MIKLNLFSGFFIFFVALVLAWMEVEIEGHQPWARNLPTWMPFGPGGPTGYHFAMWIFSLLLAHSIFVFTDLRWSVRNVLTLLSLFLLAGVAEDFLWNVINPNWNFWLFTKTCPRWYVNYPVWIMVSGLLFFLTGRLRLYPMILGVLLSLTLITVFISGFPQRKISKALIERKILSQFYNQEEMKKIIEEGIKKGVVE